MSLMTSLILQAEGPDDLELLEALRDKLEQVNLAERGLDPAQLDDDRSLVIPLDHLVVQKESMIEQACNPPGWKDPRQQFGIGQIH